MTTHTDTAYNYDPHTGTVTRGAQLVATRYADGTLDYAPGQHRYRAPVVRYLRGLGLGGELPQPADTGPAPVTPASEPTQNEPLETTAPAPAEPPPASATAREIWATVKARIAEAHADFPPDAPPPGPYGDLDPKFAEWYITHHPQRAILRYANRRFHLN